MYSKSFQPNHMQQDLTCSPDYLIGMQHDVILASQPYGLGLNETLLPQYLKELGYATHAVGKVIVRP